MATDGTIENDAQDSVRKVIAVAICMCVLESVFVLLFFVSRYLKKTFNGLQMWLMPWAYAFCLTHCIMVFGAHHHVMKHVVAPTNN